MPQNNTVDNTVDLGGGNLSSPVVPSLGAILPPEEASGDQPEPALVSRTITLPNGSIITEDLGAGGLVVRRNCVLLNFIYDYRYNEYGELETATISDRSTGESIAHTGAQERVDERDIREGLEYECWVYHERERAAKAQAAENARLRDGDHWTVATSVDGKLYFKRDKYSNKTQQQAKDAYVEYWNVYMRDRIRGVNNELNEIGKFKNKIDAAKTLELWPDPKADYYESSVQVETVA